ncbi:MAG: hypothetical protein FWD49_07455 [Firmicutes bacterium]|nr:hypothetical protein [Bacillota bacterium]
MDFKSYIRRKAQEANTATNAQSESNEAESKKNEEIKDKVNRYSQLSQEQLMEELFKVATESRKRGELSDSALDSFFNQASSFLSHEQSERMKELIGELKK